jgi:ankyrin repeat protein
MSRTHAATATTTNKASKQQRSPLEVLRSILFENPENTSNNVTKSSFLTNNKNSTIQNTTLLFQTPNQTDMEAYDMESVRAIRAGDVDRLRDLYRGGKSLDACNAFGESLLHMACRRGDVRLVRFLVEEIKVRTDRCDDFGRNPLHDAMWTSTPNIEVMDVLIDHVDPSMLLAKDVRGNTPFAYARREHESKWIEFLEQRREKLREKHDACLSVTDAETECGTTPHKALVDSVEATSTETEIETAEKKFTKT